MKTKSILAALLVGAACQLGPLVSQAQDVDSMVPVVVKTVPEAGAKDVAPGEVEIRVTFSKEMRKGSWSWSTAWKDSTPEFIGNPAYDADGKTCVVKVKLEPNKTYGFWLNSQSFHNFKDKQGRAAVPYLFASRPGASEASAQSIKEWPVRVPPRNHSEKFLTQRNALRRLSYRNIIN